MTSLYAKRFIGPPEEVGFLDFTAGEVKAHGET